MSIKRINAGARMSSAVVHGDTVYLAGLTADDAKADVKGQTKQILDKVVELEKLNRFAHSPRRRRASACLFMISRAAAFTRSLC